MWLHPFRDAGCPQRKFGPASVARLLLSPARLTVGRSRTASVNLIFGRISPFIHSPNKIDFQGMRNGQDIRLAVGSCRLHGLVQSAAKTVLALAAPQGGGARRLGGHRLLILGSLYSPQVERRFVRASAAKLAAVPAGASPA